VGLADAYAQVSPQWYEWALQEPAPAALEARRGVCLPLEPTSDPVEDDFVPPVPPPSTHPACATLDDIGRYGLLVSQSDHWDAYKRQMWCLMLLLDELRRTAEDLRRIDVKLPVTDDWQRRIQSPRLPQGLEINVGCDAQSDLALCRQQRRRVARPRSRLQDPAGGSRDALGQEVLCQLPIQALPTSVGSKPTAESSGRITSRPPRVQPLISQWSLEHLALE
jgi:hypothetical protein